MNAEDRESPEPEPPGSRSGAAEPPDSQLLHGTEHQQLGTIPPNNASDAESKANSESSLSSHPIPQSSQSPQSFKSRLLDGFLNFGLAPQILVYLTAALIFRSATMPITVSNLLGRALSWVQIKRNNQPYLVAINLLEPSEADRAQIYMLMPSAAANEETRADVALSDLVMVDNPNDLGAVIKEEGSLPPADTLADTFVDDTANGVNDSANPSAADSANDISSNADNAASVTTITVAVVDIHQAFGGHER